MYSNRYVAFVDTLGFSDIVRKTEHDETSARVARGIRIAGAPASRAAWRYRPLAAYRAAFSHCCRCF